MKSLQYITEKLKFSTNHKKWIEPMFKWKGSPYKNIEINGAGNSFGNKGTTEVEIIARNPNDTSDYIQIYFDFYDLDDEKNTVTMDTTAFYSLMQEERYDIEKGVKQDNIRKEMQNYLAQEISWAIKKMKK